MPAGRRWPWRAGAVALAVLGLCAIGAFDVAALAFLAWGVSELWRRT